jgi:hypothetical protein
MMIPLVPFLSPSDVSVIFKECIKVEVVSATDFGCLNIFKRLLMIENRFDLSMPYTHVFIMTRGVLWYCLSTFWSSLVFSRHRYVHFLVANIPLHTLCTNIEINARQPSPHSHSFIPVYFLQNIPLEQPYLRADALHALVI